MSRIDALATREVPSAPARSWTHAARWLAPALALGIGLALLGLLALAPLPDRAVLLDVGAEGPFRAPDETSEVRHLAGFHEPEFTDGVSYRWTKTWARVVVPNGHRLGTPLELRLRLCGCHPAGEQPVAQLAFDNQPAGALTTTAGYRRYSILVPPGQGDNAGSDLFIELRMPTVSIDGRPIGIRLDRLDLVAAPSPALPWPEPIALAVLGAGVALAVMWLAGGQVVRAALLAALLLAPALILGLYRHQELAPSELILAALCGVLLVALARPAQLAVALPLAVIAGALPLLPQLLGGWLVDDAFISFRYAQQLVAGHGLVFNPGERVEGYTNFLWTIGMALVLRLGGDPAHITRLLTLLIAQATIVLCYAIGRWMEDGGWRMEDGESLRASSSILGTLAAPLLLVTSGPFLLYSARGSGLETALFTLLLLAGAWAYLAQNREPRTENRGENKEQRTENKTPRTKKHPESTRPRTETQGQMAEISIPAHPLTRSLAHPLTTIVGGRSSVVGAGVLLALAALTRPEGVLVLALTAGHALVWRGPRRALTLVGGFVAIFLPYYVWRFSYYGLPLPNTFYVKVGATTAQAQRGWDYLAAYWAAEGWAWTIGLLAISVFTIVRTRNKEQRTENQEPRIGVEERATRVTAQGSHKHSTLSRPEAGGALWAKDAALRHSHPSIWPAGLLRMLSRTLSNPTLRRNTKNKEQHPAREASRITHHVSRFTFHVSQFSVLGSRFSISYLALVALAYSAYIVAVGGDWLPEARFVVPLIPLFALLAQAALGEIGRHGRGGLVLAGGLLVLALFEHGRHTLATSAYDASNLIWRENDTVARRREAGRWLRENTPPATLVAVEAAGALPYYSQRPAIDILGLNDRHIASLEVATIGQGKPGHEKTDIPYVLDRRPDIIPYFSAPYFYDYPRFGQEYAREEHDGPEGYTIILFRRK